ITGDFSGSLRTAAGRAIPNDGILQGSPDRPGPEDEVAVIYNDPDNGAGAPAQIKTTAVFSREKTVFEDQIEQGNQGWIATGSWAITGERKASGARSWTDSPGAMYANSANSSLTSPLFDFTGLQDVTLSFAHSYDTESRYDFAVVEYSNDEAVTWTRAAAFSGSQVNFTQARIPLRALDGQNRTRVRFRLFSDGAQTREGWWIDDIRLTARSANAAIIAPGSTPAPVITSVSPAFGPPAGNSTVTINGAGFTEDETTSVSFDGVPAKSFRVMGSGAIEAVTPAHAPGPVMVRVHNRNGGAGVQNGFTYYAAGSGGAMPAITTLFPSAGSTRGGTAVTLIGANFTPETEVAFGAQKAAATFINANTLRVATPAAAATGAVEVAAANGVARATLANGFNYVATSPPAVQLASLNGGETLFARSVVNIAWRSSDNRAVVRHRISLVRGATVTTIAADLPGAEQSYAWIVPTNLPSPTMARIRIIAVDDEGAESEATSSNDFTIVQRWEAQPQLPVALQRLQIASDGKFLYSFGGRATGSSTTTTTAGYRLDPAATQPAWSSADVTPMPAGLNGGEAIFLKGRIYIPGGFNVSAAQSTQHFTYDVASNTWETLTSPPVGAILYALAADDTRNVYYFTGGQPATGISARVNSYDPTAKLWNDLPSMTTARYSHEAALIDGKLYVAGGIGGSGGLVSGEVYDFSTGQWTPIAPLSRPRANAVNFVGKDAAGNPLWFVTGGQDGGAFLGTEVYDVHNNRWITLDDSFAMATRRALLNGAVAGDYFYAAGGATTTVALRNTERTRINNLSLVPLNQAPVVAVPAAQVAVAGVELRFTVSANDLGSGAPIQIAAAGAPAGASFTTENAGNNSSRGTFRWTPAAANTGQTFNVTFTASDGQLSDAKSVVIRVVSANPLAAVNSADFRTGPLAADSIASAFGENFAVRTEVARELPLPVELAGTTVTINGIPAPLFFVSPAQINFAVPSSIDAGSATIIISNPAGAYSAGTVQITASAPALFSADATGKGDAAAVATADGVTFQQPPFDVTVAGKPNILLLFATGVRRAAAANPNDENGVAEAITITIGGQPARVLYAGAQGSFAGLDQINVEIPQSLAGQGQRRVEVA
ncbi:MAG: IPT/TIG domain-containing protein, partial [Blastocatellia bacterium]